MLNNDDYNTIEGLQEDENGNENIYNNDYSNSTVILFLIFKYDNIDFDSNLNKQIHKKQIENTIPCWIYLFKCKDKGFGEIIIKQIGKFFSFNKYAKDKYYINNEKIKFIINPKFDNEDINITEYDKIKLLFKGIETYENKELKQKIMKELLNNIEFLRKYIDNINYEQLDLFELLLLISKYSEDDYYNENYIQGLIKNFNINFFMISSEKFNTNLQDIISLKNS